ncbi:MAG: GspE/PulE family protein, partial [Victivallales bacterium]|nr:GspE/PulE family protein [Victivallales bacterium]
MLEEMQHRFEKMIHIPHGIILVVGPTGSGKTTTLYSVITKLNDTKKKIITIEDPVEYRLERLSQMQVNPQIGLTFANGLRHIVRQDPDVILVGEIRDRETADIAINAALTGHLVLSTLHTNDAAGAVSRMLDMGVEGFLLSSALYGVLSQRLVRKICPHCHGTGIDHTRTGNKCRECAGTGFYERTGIFELLAVNDEIRRAIAQKASSEEIAAIAMRHGMRPILDDGLEKVRRGVTTEAEVRRSATEN